jgi:hypothetical protein
MVVEYRRSSHPVVVFLMFFFGESSNFGITSSVLSRQINGQIGFTRETFLLFHTSMCTHANARPSIME